MLDKLLPYLTTSNQQYGFKKGVGCAQAIYDVKQTFDYFTSRESTVNICALDISKAFDKINHYNLFLQLMKRQIPVDIVKLLYNWYSKLNTVLKWNKILSVPVVLTAGVRQGGILSPALFSIYIDELLTLLHESKLGCFIKGTCANSFMYADDIILLTISVHHLQKLVNICKEFLELNDLHLNGSKCKYLQIGPKNHNKCCLIKLGSDNFMWVDEIKYLTFT